MAAPINPNVYSDPPELNLDWYRDRILPFQERRIAKAEAEALRMAEYDQQKIAMRMKAVDAANERIKQLQDIKAEFKRDMSKAQTSADIKAAEARKDESLKRYQNGVDVLQGNARNITTMNSARIRASGEAAAALGKARREELSLLVEGSDRSIKNEMGTGQRDLFNNLINSSIDAPLDQIRSDEEAGVPDLIRGSQSLVEQSRATGVEYPYESVAKSVVDLGDPTQRRMAISAITSTLETPEQRARFKEVVDIYNEYKNPGEFKDKLAGSAAAGIQGGRAGVVDPNAAANMDLPEAQFDETFGKENISGYYEQAIAQTDDAINQAMSERERLYREAMDFEPPSTIDRARDIFWQKYRNGKRPAQLRGVGHRYTVQDEMDVGPPQREVFPQDEFDVGERPPRGAGTFRDAPTATEPAPPETSPAPPPAVDNPYLYWQGPVQEEVQPNPYLDYPPAQFRTIPGWPSTPTSRPIPEWLQSPTGMENPAYTRQKLIGRALGIADQAKGSSVEAANMNNDQVIRDMRIKNAPTDPQPGQLPAFDRYLERQGIPKEAPPLQAPQRVFPPGSKLKENPMTGDVEEVSKASTPRDKVFRMADGYVSKPKLLDRLMTNDPVVKTAANTYAINKRNNVPLTETVATLNQTYSDDEDKRIKAIATVITLDRRDKTGTKLETDSVKKA